MAQTVSAQKLHETFRYYYDQLNTLIAPPVGSEEIDLLLNFAQRQVQADEFRSHRAEDGRGFEMSKERKRSLQTFLSLDPVKKTFPNSVRSLPARIDLPSNHRYTVTARVSWHGLKNVFFSVTPFDHDEWQVAQQNAFQIPTYYEPALVTHGDVEELVEVEFNYLPSELQLWYLRLPEEISLSKQVGMELPSWMDERVVQAGVARAKFVAEVAGANFQQALRQMAS